MEAAPASHPADETRTYQARVAVIARYWRGWWRNVVLESVDQEEVIARRREEAYISARYLFMLAMSAGIAVLGLLLSSPAVVIGAMLIAPLMGPIIGAGFALAIGDYGWLQKSVYALAAGTLLAIALTALVVFLSPLQTVTPEIAARTRPNLFDLGVAVFSALAGAYSMIRGREGTIVGVAIATALMPPLAVVGFGIATLNWTVFSGALLLFVTNLMTIALVATIMARIYGFSARLSGRQTRLQTIIIVVVFVALAIPLFLSLRQIVWETNAARQIRTSVMEGFGSDARLSQIDFDLESKPITVDATVLTPELHPAAKQKGETTLEGLLGEQVDFRLTQYRVGTTEQAEQAQLAAARAREEEAKDERLDALARDLALVAGVTPDDVTLDRENRRAIVRAVPLAGANVQTFQQLERRIAAQYPDWTIAVQPPQLPLPEIAFADGAPTPAGRQALSTLVWAAQRTGAPVYLQGGDPETRKVAAGILADSGVSAGLAVGGPVMRARWGTAP
ncbi:DUF389 domain-containing protein [Erythrobacter sp. LQ02-29]|uniref:DUF389 domain-containing protein n=1 Tax=Erythrobacter sp. LQ02-29 TaxID=2920384 RepID=UPI00211ABBC1|nr:DUF389 domain-containing protein [Erythrobacter sp. LQ02-29]MCP9222201.1 DUF389 domain-containing protein [Erythrobacter sp. LQ02-29]